ncbi:MAG: Uma2 family endonuclease [Armatimonadetes bacterium]|nr:Uma2 family endonuclease [Armatimonadota bacterium]
MAVPAHLAPPRVPCEEIDGVLYPYAEEEAVVQGHWHYHTVRDATNMVEGLLQGWSRVGIFGDIFVYWRSGRDYRPCAPDLMVLPEIDDPERERRSLYLWRERSHPVFIMEVLSDGTADDDRGEKVRIYRDEIGIPEYFFCDPRTRPVGVWGYSLTDGRYLSIEPDRGGRVWSAELQGWFGADDDGKLRVWNAAGEPMLRYREALALARLESRRARREFRRAEEEARRADQQARRAEEEARRAEEEALRAGEQTQRAEEEARRARDAARQLATAESRVRELEADLRRLRRL